MVSSKITITKNLIKIIQEKRIENNLSASDLSVQIGRSESYISTIENGRIAKISLNDLIKIISVLFDMTEENAIEFTQNLINKGKVDDVSNELDTVKIFNYDQLDEIVNTTAFNGQLKQINKAFRTFFKHDPKQAFITFNTFIQSLASDLAFMTVLMRIPFSNLESLSHEDKQDFLNKVIVLFSKYDETDNDLADE